MNTRQSGGDLARHQCPVSTAELGDSNFEMDQTGVYIRNWGETQPRLETVTTMQDKPKLTTENAVVLPVRSTLLRLVMLDCLERMLMDVFHQHDLVRFAIVGPITFSCPCLSVLLFEVSHNTSSAAVQGPTIAAIRD